MKITAPTSRVRTSFDPELELPKLHRWFAENPHPSRITLQMYVKELNSLSSRQSRKLLEVHNLCYWFKNARAAYKRAELRLKKSSHEQVHHSNATSGQVNGQRSEQTADKQRASPGSRSPSANAQLGPPAPNSPLSEAGGAAPASELMSSSQTQTQTQTQIQMQLQPQRQLALPEHNQQQQMHTSHQQLHLGTLKSQGSPTPVVGQSALHNIDIANAVNCLLSTATNFTAAAAAAAAVAMNAGPMAPAGELLQAPPAAAFNLAASLLGSNLLAGGAQVGGQTGDPLAGCLAAALSARQPLVSANPAAMAAAALVEQPIRQLFTAFNPSGYQFPLGMLDNKVLDTNILNAMTFPTGACAPEPSLNGPSSPVGQQQLGARLPGQQPASARLSSYSSTQDGAQLRGSHYINVSQANSLSKLNQSNLKHRSRINGARADNL